ncbi:hypothetical protein Barb6_01207 [Bacteroidales bacterium Barb6]|nr:hypothetical protein Barb6_01207 [Bacteroidales bacterium Barb6]
MQHSGMWGLVVYRTGKGVLKERPNYILHFVLFFQNFPDDAILNPTFRYAS